MKLIQMLIKTTAPGVLVFALVFFLIAPAHAQDVDSLSLESLLSENVSTASKYEQTVAEAPASVTIITAEQIERYGYTSLNEVLGTVRGFYLAKDRMISYLGTRGFNRMVDYNNRVLVLMNGHSLNDRVVGTAPIGQGTILDLSMVDRIEVVRGPGSVLYGTGAMFAVVNIITKQAPTHDGLTGRAEYGSLGHVKAAATFGKAFANGLNLFATSAFTDIAGPDVYFSEFDTPATNYGIAEDLDWLRNYGAHVAGRYKRWSAQGSLKFWRTGIPSGDFGSIFNHQDAETGTSHAFFEAKYGHEFGLDKTLSVRSFFASGRYEIIYPFRIDLPALGLTGHRVNYSLVTHHQVLGVESSFTWDLRTDNRLMLGAEFTYLPAVDVESKILFKAEGSELAIFDDSFPYRVFSFYAQDEYQVRPNLALTLGLRQDFYSRTGAATTPRVAVVYHPFGTTTLKLLHGQAYREPSTLELFFDNSTDIGGVLPVASNAALQPERIGTTEFIWEQHLAQGWAATASLYQYTVKDLVAPSLIPDESSLFQFGNVNRVEAKGIEFEVNSRPDARAQLYASYSYQHTHQYEPDAPLTNSPSHLVKTGLSVDAGRYATVAAEVFYESARRTVEGATTDSYWLANLHLSTRPLWDHWRVSLRVHNALNTEYYLPASQQHLQDRFLQDGRKVVLRLSYTL